MKQLRASLRAIAAAEMAQDSAHDLAHLDRVWRNCLKIAPQEQGDLRVLLAGAYLHDLVNLAKDAANRAEASQLAAAAAPPHLRDLNYSETEIAEVQHAIASHSFSAGIEPVSREAKILRDADRLDALGAIGLARSFAVSGQLGRAIYHPKDPFAQHRSPDDSQYALDHWPLKLLQLPETMLTATGRQLAKRRLLTMARFLTDLAEEIDAPVPTHWIPPCA